MENDEKNFKSKTVERTKEYWENRPNIYEMSYNDFANEYEETMNIARKKEPKGNLDPQCQNYIRMTEEEIMLHEKDWKEFSRQRGFNDYDIAEYERWLKISGQTDKLEFAKNDPWRRQKPAWESQLYIKHIERALNLGITVSPNVMIDYINLKRDIEKRTSHLSAAVGLTDENEASKVK